MPNLCFRLLLLRDSVEDAPAEAETGAASSSAGTCAAASADRDWAQAYLEHIGEGLSSRSSLACAAAGDEGETEDDPTEDALGEAFREASAHAEEMVASDIVVLNDFVSFCRGSESTKKKKGYTFDVVRGIAESQEAIDFCKGSGMFQSRSCDIRKHGDDPVNATVLVNEWCRRMQWLLDEHRSKEAGGTPTPYANTAEYQAWYDKQSAPSQARQTADDLVRGCGAFS